MKIPVTLGTLILVAASTEALITAQGTTPEALARAAAAAAHQVAPTNADVAGALFRGRIRAVIPEYDKFVSVSTGSITIAASGPTGMFEIQFLNRIRRFESIEKMEWAPYVAVHVSPQTISSPDIDRVIALRDGKPHEPLKSMLVPTPMQSGGGATVVRHAGSALFDPAVFAPGAEVTIVAMPVTGQNIVKKLLPSELAALR
jgi:hypothetical protein